MKVALLTLAIVAFASGVISDLWLIAMAAKQLGFL